MNPVKAILIILLIIILRAFLTQESLTLIKRVVAFLMFFTLLILVLYPALSTFIANRIGVGRGVDLIFYFSHLFLLLLIISLWRRIIVLTSEITKLSRMIALQRPNKPKS